MGQTLKLDLILLRNAGMVEVRLCVGPLLLCHRQMPKRRMAGNISRITQQRQLCHCALGSLITFLFLFVAVIVTKSPGFGRGPGLQGPIASALIQKVGHAASFGKEILISLSVIFIRR